MQMGSNSVTQAESNPVTVAESSPAIVAESNPIIEEELCITHNNDNGDLRTILLPCISEESKVDISVAGNSPGSPLLPQMAPECKANTNILRPINLLGSNRDKTGHFTIQLNDATGSTLNSPLTPNTPSPTSSSDKTDNHEFGFNPDAPDMRREDERLKTFAKWPVPFLKPEELARSGFYYLGRSDEVRCAFCKVEIMRWEEGDDPAADHERWAPQCPLLRRKPVGNVPLNGPPVGAQDGHDECGVRAPPQAAVRTPGPPANPRYASQDARLRSFKDWPRSMRQKPEDLADAGFFYTGQGDKTKCFYCDGGLKDWEDDDVPWEQHARWFDRCAYVQLVKGRDYVQKVMSENCAIAPSKNSTGAVTITPNTAAADSAKHTPSETPAPPQPVEKADEINTDDSNLCKICYAEERNACFVPCGHVVACAKCALTTDKCPMCRRTFQSVVRLYFS